jgi:serine/threonine-protein kinase
LERVGEPTITDSKGAAPGVDLLTAGSRFARYEIVRCIGVVFEATHSLLRKRVALKALHATLGRSDASRARFLREAETVARIRHPNVVDISDVGVERNIPFLVMEFLEGEDLAALLEREGKLSVARTIDLLLPAVAGLCAVHRLGIVHRDIKPENIFLAVDSLGAMVPKLLDFGVSKDLDASSSEGAPLRHTVAGTPYYMSPEQARGAGNLDARADQYAMAVVVYQCLAHARPFYSDSLLELLHMIDAGEYKPLRSVAPDVPEALASVIARAMSRRLEERYPTSEAFGQALSLFASDAVRGACMRDFSAERRSALPPAQRRYSDAQREQLSAPTRESDDKLSEPPAAIDERPSKLSGVRARDTEPLGEGALPARSRRAFILAFGVTLILLLVVGALLYEVPQRKQTPMTIEPKRRPARLTEPAAPKVEASQGGAVAPRAAPSQAPPSAAPSRAPELTNERDQLRPRVRPKRDEGPSGEPTPPVDIQLSR